MKTVLNRRKTSDKPRIRTRAYIASYAISCNKSKFTANGGPASGYSLWLQPLAKRLLRNHFGLFNQGPARLLRARGVASMLTPSKDQEEAERFRQGIRDYLKRTPKDVAKWSYQQACAFKEVCKRATKTAESKKATTEKLYQSFRDLGGYY